MRFSTGRPLHRETLLRKSVGQTEAGNYLRGTIWMGVSKVIEESRPYCASKMKVELYEDFLVRDAQR